MANLKSSKKDLKQSRDAKGRNDARRNKCRTLTSAVKKAIDANEDYNTVLKKFVLLESQLQRAVNKNIYHVNTAARKISQLRFCVEAHSEALKLADAV